jgi:hypothetical protein
LRSFYFICPLGKRTFSEQEKEYDAQGFWTSNAASSNKQSRYFKEHTSPRTLKYFEYRRFVRQPTARTRGLRTPRQDAVSFWHAERRKDFISFHEAQYAEAVYNAEQRIYQLIAEAQAKGAKLQAASDSFAQYQASYEADSIRAQQEDEMMYASRRRLSSSSTSATMPSFVSSTSPEAAMTPNTSYTSSPPAISESDHNSSDSEHIQSISANPQLPETSEDTISQVKERSSVPATQNHDAAEQRDIRSIAIDAQTADPRVDSLLPSSTSDGGMSASGNEGDGATQALRDADNTLSDPATQKDNGGAQMNLTIAKTVPAESLEKKSDVFSSLLEGLTAATEDLEPTAGFYHDVEGCNPEELRRLNPEASRWRNYTSILGVVGNQDDGNNEGLRDAEHTDEHIGGIGCNSREYDDDEEDDCYDPDNDGGNEPDEWEYDEEDETGDDYDPDDYDDPSKEC